MSGIDKIMARLSSDSENECAAITNSAKEKADSIINKAREDAKKQADEIIRAAENQAAETVRLAEAADAMRSRQAELAAKVSLLDSVLAETLRELNSMSGDEYFAVMGSLAVKNAQQGDGVMLMSESDFSNMPADFIENVNNLISDKGSLTAKADSKFTKKGIILVYGDIEINLTFDAIMSADEDVLKDTARQILFS